MIVSDRFATEGSPMRQAVSALLALFVSASVTLAQTNPFFAIFEDGQPKQVVTDTGETQPVFIGAGLEPPPECGFGSWFASTAEAMKGVWIQCGTNEKFFVNALGGENQKPLEPLPPGGSEWPGPMGKQDDAQ